MKLEFLNIFGNRIRIHQSCFRNEQVCLPTEKTINYKVKPRKFFWKQCHCCAMTYQYNQNWRSVCREPLSLQPAGRAKSFRKQTIQNFTRLVLREYYYQSLWDAQLLSSPLNFLSTFKSLQLTAKLRLLFLCSPADMYLSAVCSTALSFQGDQSTWHHQERPFFLVGSQVGLYLLIIARQICTLEGSLVINITGSSLL